MIRAIHRPEIGRLGSAARPAGHSQPGRIHLRTADQVVDRPHAVPDHVPRERRPGDEALRARVRMLERGLADSGRLLLSVPVLIALALPDWIHREHDEALPDEVENHRHVGDVAKPRGGMPAQVENRGCPVLHAFRHEQHAGDEEVRHRFEHDLLESVPFLADDTRHPRVEGRLLRKRADDPVERRLDLRLTPRHCEAVRSRAILSRRASSNAKASSARWW